MGSDDMLLLSMGINIGLIYINHKLSKKLDHITDFMARTMIVMKAIAEGKITLKIVGTEVHIVNLKENINGNQASE